MNKAQEIARGLLKINAITINTDNPYTWSSGLVSPLYCDNRLSLTYPMLRTKIRDGFSEMASKHKINHISGVATAGIPHGAILAEHLNLPFSYVRGSAKKHGLKNRIEGQVQEKDKILLVEDLISTGKSSISAVKALREVGAEVKVVFAIFSYGFPNSLSLFRKQNITFETLTDLSAVVDVAVEKKILNSEQVVQIKEWRDDPIAWSKKNSNI